MALPEPHGFFVEPLERAGLTYCVTGSLAAGLYGEPRLTRDIDVILTLPVSMLTHFLKAFSSDDFYVPPVENILEEVQRPERGMFNLLHMSSGFKADIFVAAGDPLHAWALRHRRRKAYDENKPDQDLLWVAPPEYVVIRKLEYYREAKYQKHLRDIRFMLATTDMNFDFISSQVERLSLHGPWQAIHAAPPDSTSA